MIFEGLHFCFEFSYLRWVNMCGTVSSCGVFITNKRFICFSSSRAKLVTLSEETRLKWRYLNEPWTTQGSIFLLLYHGLLSVLWFDWFFSLGCPAAVNQSELVTISTCKLLLSVIRTLCVLHFVLHFVFDSIDSFLFRNRILIVVVIWTKILPSPDCMWTR